MRSTSICCTVKLTELFLHSRGVDYSQRGDPIVVGIVSLSEEDVTHPNNLRFYVCCMVMFFLSTMSLFSEERTHSLPTLSSASMNYTKDTRSYSVDKAIQKEVGDWKVHILSETQPSSLKGDWRLLSEYTLDLKAYYDSSGEKKYRFVEKINDRRSVIVPKDKIRDALSRLKDSEIIDVSDDENFNKLNEKNYGERLYLCRFISLYSFSHSVYILDNAIVIKTLLDVKDYDQSAIILSSSTPIQKIYYDTSERVCMVSWMGLADKSIERASP